MQKLEPAPVAPEPVGPGSLLLPLLVLTLSAFAAFGVVLGGYFIADDTWQMQFVYRVFHGEWRLVFDNFTHSYLGLPSMDFYRPLLGLTYLADYALYHTAAWGFYLTNILLAILAAFALFFYLRLLARASMKSERADLFAFISALLFVVSPLHAEDICWISGRADLLTAPFYLFGLLAAVRARDWQSGKLHWPAYSLSLAAFVLALLSKESAVTLPLVVVAMFIYFRSVATEKIAFMSALAKFSTFFSPYALLTVAYLFVRKQALGSFIGGYTGDMGEALGKWLLFRWGDPLNLCRLAFPVAKHSFHFIHRQVEQTPAILILGTIYAIILSILLIRLITQRLDLRLAFFLFLWLLASIVPLFQLWGLDAALHNQRVLYLYTAPMVALLPALIFATSKGDRPSMKKQLMVLSEGLEQFLLGASSIAFYALAASLAVASALASYNWVLAGQQVRAIQEKTATLIEANLQDPKADKKIIVVSVPKDYLGAHVLMGGVNMLELLEPPFNKEKISKYMIGFQRALVGPGEPVNSSRFKLELSELKVKRAYFWDVDRRDYKIVEYDQPLLDTPPSIELPIMDTAPVKGGARPQRVWYPDPAERARFEVVDGVKTVFLSRLNIQGGDGLMITGLDINPLAYDYLNMSIELPRAQAATGVYVGFDDKEDASAPFDDEPQVSKLLQVTKVPAGAKMAVTRMNIKVSHFGQWYSYRKIRRLKLSFSNIDAVSISQISLSDDRALMPQLFVMEAEPQASGEYFYQGGEAVKFAASSGMVAGARSVLVQISKVNQSWDTFLTETGRDSVVNLSCIVPLKDGKAYFKLDPTAYSKNGFYDVRAALLNDRNQIISDWSDLITLYRPDPGGKVATFCPDY
ncbi:MAG: hypothetical protein KGS72_02590 [Cyanobacteria bacterium REEB67]|nr:hypothetical protein [Cyanobacteria bacterium REEB67]